jgi:uncharacterized membrane protein
VKKLILVVAVILAIAHNAAAQEYFVINKYNVFIRINQDASLDIDETIQVTFTTERHGIMRYIPFLYDKQSLSEGTERANRYWEPGDKVHTIIENIKVDNHKYEVNTEGSYKVIKIGSASKYVSGQQEYNIHYRILNAINFFDDHSEFYFNIIGDRWNTTIDKANFTIALYKPLPEKPFSFVATGQSGSRENNTQTHWTDNTFSGFTTKPLGIYEGITVGIRLPKDFLEQQDYRFRGFAWMLLPLLVLLLAYYLWRRFGKDDDVTIQTEYYPPANVSPSISGYIIDDKLNRRDLTALVPYWGAGGYLQVNELQSESFFGLVKNKEYEFVKLKDLPVNAASFEKTLFDGIFATGDRVMLKDLKNVLYKTMAVANKHLMSEVKRHEYYVKGSRETGVAFIVVGVLLGIGGFISTVNYFYDNKWQGIAMFISGAILIAFGAFMSKKTKNGTLLYQQLAGFREFISTVERDRLREFLKQDEHYFDKILPYAIVFNIADTWKDKLEGLDIPPPSWYHGNYQTFNISSYMHSLNNSMNSMSSTFYSAPRSSGSSGGSFGGGGSSGGGFGGGGGSSW